MRYNLLWRSLQFFFCILLSTTSSYALNAKCPGGASPDPLWEKCIDFESTAGCTVGNESGCWTGNGFSSLEDSNGEGTTIIVTDPDHAVVGSRYAKLKGKFGGTGPPYANITLTADNQYVTRMAQYIRFDKFPHYYYNHIIGISIAGASPSCNRGITLEVGGQSSAYLYSSGSCGVTTVSELMAPNQGPSAVPIIKSNKWYLFEQLVKMDTSCTDDEDAHGCNGIYKLWIDGVLVISYTDLNLGGVTNSAKIVAATPVRNYYHKRIPSWRPEVWVDEITITSDETNMIGASTGASNIGTADTDPYGIECGIEPFYVASNKTHSPESDWYSQSYRTACGTPGDGYGDSGGTWRGNALTFTTTNPHTGVIVDSHPAGVDAEGVTRPIAEQAAVATCTGANCGAGFYFYRMGGAANGNEGDGTANNPYRVTALPQQSIYGFIKLPSTSSPNGVIAYHGFRGGSSVIENYVAVSESAGNWAIATRYAGGTPTVELTTSTAITRDVWHQFQIMVWNSQKVSLMIDGTLLKDKVDLSGSVDWLFNSTNTAANSGGVFGIIDYRGTGTVSVHMDDLASGSISFWNCDGWSDASCPFPRSYVGGTMGSFITRIGRR